jgi:flagellar protein FliS
MWRDAYLDTQILSADPLELVHIVYEHTLTMVGDARRHLAAGNVPARGRSISRAIEAIAELDAALDRQAGGEIARNLAAIYEYLRLRLLTANIRQEDEPLAEVEKLLRTLGEAWSAIRPAAAAGSCETVEAKREFPAFSAELQAAYVGQGWNA